MAEILAVDGYRMGITGRKKVNLEKIQQTNPQAFIIHDFDVQDVYTSQRMIQEIIDELGGLY